jgi:hypothetical protein
VKFLDHTRGAARAGTVLMLGGALLAMGTTAQAAGSPSPGGARGWSESAWSASAAEGPGSGCPVYEPKPAWQTDTGCIRRTVADVSAVADPATGVAVYDSFNGEGGWNVYGGTSAASPIIASVYALAGAPAAGTTPASYPYAHTADLYDVATGSTGTCTPAYLCTAEIGYDGPTGLGTPDGAAAFTPNTGDSTGLANALQAFQGTNGDLWTASPSGGTDLGLAMKPGTSPSITAVVSTGSYEIAYQGANGDLRVTPPHGTATDSHLGMMSGTSPAIAAAAGGFSDLAFHASSGDVWNYSPPTGLPYDLNLAMASGTSPSIAQ